MADECPQRSILFRAAIFHMDFLCGLELSLSVMRTVGSCAMRRGHRVVMMSGESHMRASETGDAVSGGFWPEVSSRYSQEDPAQLRRENSSGRVFLEVLLVLGVAGLMAVAAAIWIPILS
jgi:hypothetical protein